MFGIQEDVCSPVQVMTDGHFVSAQLYEASLDEAFKVEVKGAEDHYAWGTIQHSVDEEPAV